MCRGATGRSQVLEKLPGIPPRKSLREKPLSACRQGIVRRSRDLAHTLLKERQKDSPGSSRAVLASEVPAPSWRYFARPVLGGPLVRASAVDPSSQGDLVCRAVGNSWLAPVRPGMDGRAGAPGVFLALALKLTSRVSVANLAGSLAPPSQRDAPTAWAGRLSTRPSRGCGVDIHGARSRPFRDGPLLKPIARPTAYHCPWRRFAE